MSKGAFVVATIAVLGAIAGVIAAVQYNQNVATLQAVDNQVMNDLFSHWKLANGKVYASEQEEAVKFTTFKNNYLFILNWNADLTQTSQVGLN